MKEILPVARALRRRKLGAALIGLQMALSVAILANAVNIIQQRLQHMARPTGLDEAGLITLSNQFTGPDADLAARIQGDLAQLRTIAGVEDAAALFGLPLSGNGQASTVALALNQREPNAIVAEYMMTDRAMRLLGLRLIAGRAFTPSEVHDFRGGAEASQQTVLIVSRALALRLFPNGDALGKRVYLDRPGRIVGVVARAQAPWAANDEGSGIFGAGSEYAAFEPFQAVNSQITYAIRAQPGRGDALLPAAEERLYAVSRERVVSNAHTFAEVRAAQYRSDRALALILVVVCALMLSVAGLGVIALTSYWVAQRRRQIGMRRALGASSRDILVYFHTENALIAGAGTVLGIGAGYAASLWIAAEQGVAQLGVVHLCVSGAAILCLSQLAVLWPALRAASLSPAIAIRGI